MDKLTAEEIAWVKEQHKAHSQIPRGSGNGIRFWECQNCDAMLFNEAEKEAHVCPNKDITGGQ